jgi:hypothetical protein
MNPRRALAYAAAAAAVAVLALQLALLLANRVLLPRILVPRMPTWSVSEMAFGKWSVHPQAQACSCDVHVTLLCRSALPPALFGNATLERGDATLYYRGQYIGTAGLREPGLVATAEDGMAGLPLRATLALDRVPTALMARMLVETAALTFEARGSLMLRFRGAPKAVPLGITCVQTIRANVLPAQLMHSDCTYEPGPGVRFRHAFRHAPGATDYAALPWDDVPGG